MITVRLRGGMGNQMFQYAFGKSLSILKNTSFVLDKRYLEDRTPIANFVYRNYDLDIFNINPQFKEYPPLYKNQIFVNKYINLLAAYAYKYLKIKFAWYYLENNFRYDPEFQNVSNNAVVDGYFQSYKYFENIKDVILEDFRFKNPISKYCVELLDEIRTNNSVCVNVRRGDFLIDKLLGAKDNSYYSSGADYLNDRIDNPKIYVFSDDIEWCKDNLKFSAPTTYVNHSYAGEKFRDYFELMINCKHFVIPNSSFGWWAAYLGDHKNKIVVCPKLWFSDIRINNDDMIPSGWIKL